MAEISKPDFQYVWASGGSIVAPVMLKYKLAGLLKSLPSNGKTGHRIVKTLLSINLKDI